MRTMLTVLAVAILGLFGATSLGYAAYLVSRDSVGLPVTKLDPSPLAPTPAQTTKQPAAKPKPKRVVPPPPPPPPSTTPREPGDDHGGRSGGGSDSSGHGGRGGDD